MAPPTAAAVLRLQRSAGNRAVTQMIARYESPEHADLGDRYAKELGAFIGTDEGRAWVKQYGLEQDVKGLESDWYAQGKRQIGTASRTLSPGEIIALSGDFYETWEKFAAAPDAEINEILGAIGEERAGKLANANAKYEEITKKHRSDKHDHYLELAKRNTPHFTPGNRKQWRKMHVEALELAKQGKTVYGSDQGEAHDKDFEKALFVDAAAGHFLTDAFASGHLFDKDKLEIEIMSYLRANPAKASNPEMGGYYGVMDAAGVTPQLVLKNVHDRMNREGFEVTNKRGMSWRTFGDQYLSKATETQKIAALAIYVSRQQVFSARAGKNPDPEDVLAFFPDEASIERATKLACSYIPAAAADIGGLIYRQRSMAPTQFGPIVGGIIQSNIETIGSPGRERQLLDIKERAERTGQPQVAPQFTVTSW
jgi:hypothetical protein